MAEDDAPWSNLGFDEEAAVFKGPTQNARVLSEGWVAANAFCPSCGATPLTAFAANSPVADFHCGVCAEEYELKATKGRTDTKLVNGAWGAMKARLAAANNPSLMVMGYDKARTLIFRHPPASRAFAAQTGGPSGAREREPVADGFAETFRLRFASAPPPVRLRLPEDDDGSPGLAALAGG